MVLTCMKLHPFTDEIVHLNVLLCASVCTSSRDCKYYSLQKSYLQKVRPAAACSQSIKPAGWAAVCLLQELQLSTFFFVS